MLRILVALFILGLSCKGLVRAEEEKPADLSQEDREIIQNLELLQELEMLENVDLLEDYEAVKDMETLESEGESDEEGN